MFLINDAIWTFITPSILHPPASNRAPFGKSSKRLDDLFKRTKLYRNNLESYVRGDGMTRRTKLKIVATVTVLMGTGFILMRGVPVGRIVLAIVWVLHLVYFLFVVKTVPPRERSGNPDTLSASRRQHQDFQQQFVEDETAMNGDAEF